MPTTGGAAAPAKCSVCDLVFHVVPSTGCSIQVLVDHFPPCVGSGLLLLGNSHDEDPGVVDLDVRMCRSPASLTASESVINESIEPFPMSPPSFKLVKRSTRHKAAIVFESCLRDVINVGSLPH